MWALTRVPRTPLPPAPYVVAGLRRAGLAAAHALVACGFAGTRAWDIEARAETEDAERELAGLGVEVVLGGDGTALLDLGPAPRSLVKSPGVPLDAPIVDAARARGIEVIDEAELGWRLDPRPYVGVTGTNGKGTSAALLCAALAAAGIQPLLAGNTHFGPPLSEAVREPGDVIVAELSSFQLAGSPALLPEAALFTNLGRQHWDFHGGRRAYADAKRRMFVRGERATALASVNVDDWLGRELAHDVEVRGGRVARYGSSADADFRLVAARWTVGRGRATVETPSGLVELDTRLPGNHNALNLTGALALVELAGLRSAAVREGLAATLPLPGRFEPVTVRAPFTIVVDFAHNPEGVAAVLRAGRVLVDVGAGGRLRALSAPLWVHDADMRQATVRTLRGLADDVMLTTQRWRREEPLAPPPDVVELAGPGGGAPCTVVNRRADAIRMLVERARAGDVLMILGRGNGPFPLYDDGDKPRPFDDREVAAAAASRWSAPAAARATPE